MNYYLGVWKKFAEFSGRAGRPEYWYFTLFNILAYIILSILDNAVGFSSAAAGGVGLFGGIYSLAVLIPSLAVSVRRLHDTGRSGWWILIGLIPVIGAIVLLVFMILKSDEGANEYGAPYAPASAAPAE